MTLRRTELITPETIKKDYESYVWRMRSESLGIMFLISEAKEYGAQPETLALLEQSLANFNRICEIEFPKDGN